MPPKKRSQSKSKTTERETETTRKVRKPMKRATKQAKRAVNAAYRPSQDALDREGSRAESDFNNVDNQVANIYEDLQAILGPLAPKFDKLSQGVIDDYSAKIGDFGTTFSDSFAPAEAIGGDVGAAAADAAAAAANLYGTVGTGGLNMLSSDRLGTNSFLTRMGVVGGLAEKDTRLNALDGYRDFIDQLRERRMDLQGQKAADRLAAIDQILQNNREFGLKKRELEIAEEQFGKEFGLKKKMVNNERRDERRGERTAIRIATDQQEDKQARRTLKRTKPKINRIDNRIAGTQAELDVMGGTESAALRPPLEKRMDRLEKKRSKVQRKRKRARRELRD